MRRVGLPLGIVLAIAGSSAWFLGGGESHQRGVSLGAAASGRGRLPQPARSSPGSDSNGRSRAVGHHTSGVAKQDPKHPAPYAINSWQRVEDLPRPIAVFDTVFWEPADTRSLRKMLATRASVRGKRVLEIGTGTGLLSLCCLRAGATEVVATDINPAAVSNASFNARLLGLENHLEVRQVPLDRPEAFSVIAQSEQFDLIISNPPWENDHPESIDKYAYFDQNFRLLHSLLEGLNDHLSSGGKALVAYGSVDGIRTLQRLAPKFGLETKVWDRRSLEGLPSVFLPGMLIEIVPKPDLSIVGTPKQGHSVARPDHDDQVPDIPGR